MIIEDVTIQDCQREALLETQIVVAQRKIDRLFKQIAFKEEIAQGLMSQWFCEHYDHEVGTRYEAIALLEGAVRAAKLELDRLADKRYADKARRLAALALIEEVGKKATTGTTPPAAPSSDPRQKQQSMFFGPGEPPAAPAKSASPSVTVDQKAEDDIARAFEICSREIPPPDPTPATSTPAAAASTTNAAPLTRPTLSRTMTAPEIAGSAGQAEMAAEDDAVPADEDVSASAEGLTTSTAAPATADAKDSANDPPTQAGTTPLDGAGSERAEGDGPSGMN